MKTQANTKSENVMPVNKQMRLALTLIGIVVAVVGSLTLVYGNHSTADLGFEPQVTETTMVPITLSPQVVVMHVVAAVWPF